MLIGRTTIEHLTSLPWLHLADALPSTCETFPWKQLSASDRASIQQQQTESPWYPDVLCPFKEEAQIDPMTSIGLRYRDQVIGWMITHRIAKDTLRYTSLFVKQDLQKVGYAIPLLARAIRLQIEAKIATHSTYTVLLNNTPMMNFVYRR